MELVSAFKLSGGQRCKDSELPPLFVALFKLEFVLNFSVKTILKYTY